MNNLSFNKMNYLLFNFNKNNWFLNIVKCLYYCCFLLSIVDQKKKSIIINYVCYYDCYYIYYFIF